VTVPTLLDATYTGRFERVALFADVHGNPWALRAAVAEAQSVGVDAYFFLGCLTWGPKPREVVEMATNASVPTFLLRGNGDRAAWEIATGARPAERPVDRWMVEAHGPDVVELIGTWPSALIVEVADHGRVRLCHGSPRSDIELLTPRTPQHRIAEACRGVAEATIVHGHTHLQYQRTSAGKRIAGCGSVGLPYTEDPGFAYWTLVDASGVHAQRTRYDVASTAARVRESGYPEAERFVRNLLTPPTPSEIIADAETREFSD
jgi:predicted phosphodiesterase